MIMETDASVNRPFRKSAWTPVILIALAGIAVYLTSLPGAFIWDDIHFIRNNVYLRSVAYLPRIVTGDVAAGSGETYNYYRPLTTVTYLADYAAWGLNPAGYHVSSILFHVLAAVAVYFLLFLLYRDKLLAFIAGLLFVLHPIQTETVAYISGRPDSLAALCLLACFISYLKNLDSRHLSVSILTVFFYLLALLSRENSVVLPALILLYHVAFRKKVAFPVFLVLATMAAGYVLLRALLMAPAVVPTALSERLPGFFASLTGYLKLVFIPVDLHQEYGFVLFRPDDPRVLGGVMIAAVFLLIAVRGCLRKPVSLVLFSIGWFFIGLGPVSGIYPIKTYIAEHWLYLPSIGIFTLISAGYVRLLRSDRHRRPVLAAGTAVLLLYGLLTAHQNGYFRDPLTFYERTLVYTPESARMHNNLGNIYFTRGRVEDAARSYREAMTLEPDYPNPYNNLGNIYYRSGEFDKAIPLFQHAIELNPWYAAAYNNLGIIYCRQGRAEEGIALLKRSAVINPRDPDTFYNLGVVYDLTDKPEEAAEAYRESLKLMPDSGRAHSRLSETLRRLGQHGQADY
ncbi:MAG: tetratricopeptide repeat protein, partial [PVC group bacterium]